VIVCDKCGEWRSGGERCPRCRTCRGHYEPSPDEIAVACASVQTTWSRDDERKRRGTRRLPVEMPRMALRELVG
jgi:hypothetical protein